MLGFGLLLLLAARAATLPRPQVSYIDVGKMRQLLTAVANSLNYENAQLKDDGEGTPPKTSESWSSLFGVDLIQNNPRIKGNLTTSNTTFLCAYRATPRIERDSSRQRKYQIHLKNNCSFSGNYTVDGNVLRHDVKGSGHFEFQSPLLNVDFNDIKLYETEGQPLRVESLGFSMNIAILKVVIDGLTVEGMSASDFKNQLGASFMTAFGDTLPRAGFFTVVESAFKEQLNKDIANKTMDSLIEEINKGNELAKAALLKGGREVREVEMEEDEEAEEEKWEEDEEENVDKEEDNNIGKERSAR